MAEEAVEIVGDILIDPPVALDGALAIVRLRETPLADAPARNVAIAHMPCSGAAIRKIAFRLAATIDRSRQYSLAAEVRRGGGDRLHPGDLLTVEHHGWGVGERNRVELRARSIS